MSDKEASDMDESISTQRTNLSYDYDADDELNYEEIIKELLPKLVQKGTIFGEIEGSPDDEVPKGRIPEKDESTLTQEEETEVEDAVKTEIGELTITIEEDTEQLKQQLSTISEENPEQLEQQLSTISEEQLRRSTRLKKQTERYIPPVIIKVKRPEKKTVTEPKLVESSSQFTQEAENVLNMSQASTAATSFIEKKVRLETRKPDDQASSIYTPIELKKFTNCYLCGFDFKDRVSVKHNKRWYPKELTRVTKSYDHTAPVNFSFIVSRIPSQYYKLAEYEKEYLKSNGKYACFHCNFTKSQMMFITCPKVGGKVNFDMFDINPPEIEGFLKKLWENNSEWRIGPNNTNTLDECIIKKYRGDADKWMVDRSLAIGASAKQVCTMIKTHVDQTNVAKRFYYTKLLIKTAKKLLETDLYMQAENIPDKKKKEYAKKFIAHFVAKAEGCDLRFVLPWKKIPFAIGTSPKSKNTIYSNQITRKVKPPVNQAKTTLKRSRIEVPTAPIPNYAMPTQSSSAKTTQKRRGSSRRNKTYRRIRLF